MIVGYGGVCLMCEETDPVVLVLDHINDGGGKERRGCYRTQGPTLYLALKRAGWPQDKYQLLCHNCNFRKEYKRRNAAVLARLAT